MARSIKSGVYTPRRKPDPLEAKKAWIRDAARDFIKSETSPWDGTTDESRSHDAFVSTDLAAKIWDQVESVYGDTNVGDADD